MENNFNSTEELKTIRKIMEESTRFLSISGLSFVFMGLIAIAGAFIAYLSVTYSWNTDYYKGVAITQENFAALSLRLVIDASLVLLLSGITALYFSLRKTSRSGKSFWTPVSKRFIVNLMIPLITGGVFALILLSRQQIALIIPVFLIFYGIALVNAWKFTYNEILYLGILEILTGLLSAILMTNGLIFWMTGFGILHIAYGIFMYRKYEA